MTIHYTKTRLLYFTLLYLGVQQLKTLNNQKSKNQRYCAMRHVEQSTSWKIIRHQGLTIYQQKCWKQANRSYSVKVDHWQNLGEWLLATRLGNLRIDHHTKSFRNCRLCEKHRTISLISHAAKVTWEIIRMCIKYYLEQHIADERFGFVSGKGTTEAIMTLRNVIEKSVKRQKSMRNHLTPWIMIPCGQHYFGVPPHLIWLLKRLYDETERVIRVGNDHTAPFSFERGFRQDCGLSPLLFIICGEIMRLVEMALKIEEDVS